MSRIINFETLARKNEGAIFYMSTYEYVVPENGKKKKKKKTFTYNDELITKQKLHFNWRICFIIKEKFYLIRNNKNTRFSGWKW